MARHKPRPELEPSTLRIPEGGYIDDLDPSPLWARDLRASFVVNREALEAIANRLDSGRHSNRAEWARYFRRQRGWRID